MLTKFVGGIEGKGTENDEARSQTVGVDEMQAVPFFLLGGRRKKFGSERR
jgi:hypothetical protein